jgi:hypothetical protein
LEAGYLKSPPRKKKYLSRLPEKDFLHANKKCFVPAKHPSPLSGSLKGA